MRKRLLMLVLVGLVLAVGCQSLMHTLTFGLWPDKEVSTTQPSAVTPSGPTTADTWQKLALVGVVFGVAIGLATWKLPFLTVPLVALMSALGILIVVQMLLKTILVGLLIVAALAALAFLVWVVLLKRKVSEVTGALGTVVDGVEVANNKDVKARIANLAAERGTDKPLDAVLAERGYLAPALPMTTAPTLSKTLT